jgi:hypothetical protein
MARAQGGGKLTTAKKLMMGAGDMPPSHLAVPTQSTVEIFSATEGSLSGPSVAPLVTLSAPQARVAYSKDGLYLAMAIAHTSFTGVNALIAYVREGDEYVRLPNFSGQVPPSTAAVVSISPDGVYLAATGDFSGIYIYKRSGDQFSFLVNLGYGTSLSDLQFSSDGIYLIASNEGSMRQYRRTGDLFTNVTEHSSIATGKRPVALSSDAMYVADAPSSQASGLWFRIFKRGASDGLTQIPAASFTGLLPSSVCADIAFSPSGNFFAAVSGSYLYIYRRNGDTFSAISIAQPTLGTLGALVFDSSGNLYIAGYNSPYLQYYKYNGSNSFTKSDVTFDSLSYRVISIDVFPNATYGE